AAERTAAELVGAGPTGPERTPERSDGNRGRTERTLERSNPDRGRTERRERSKSDRSRVERTPERGDGDRSRVERTPERSNADRGRAERTPERTVDRDAAERVETAPKQHQATSCDPIYVEDLMTRAAIQYDSGAPDTALALTRTALGC